jgi:two-component system nitrogen regulation response regulator GlnG
MPVSETIESLRLVGKSDAMQQVYKMIGRLCNVDLSILLLGEKGSGKKLVAEALHFFSHRASSPFHIIKGSEVRECPDEELLGITETHDGNATCYITEFSAMPVFSQHQLLNIHKKKEYKCSHNNRRKKHNLRFIVATDHSIKEELESGKIQADLFYDWNFLPILLPPLRDRKEDIPLYADHFLEKFSSEMKVSRKQLTPEAIDILLNHDWPGNVDELKLAMHTSLSNCRGNYIRAEHLPGFKKVGQGESESYERLRAFLNSKLSSYIQHSPLNSSGDLYRLLLPQIEKSLFQYALNKSKGNKNKAAALLGLHRNTLNKKLQKRSG